MATPPSLHDLKNQRLIWQASQKISRSDNIIASGYASLDKKLNGGWPAWGVVEITPKHLGIGELRLIIPALEYLNRHNKLQAWVNPPARITPQNLGTTDLSQTIIATPRKSKDHYWAAEQFLNSACCSSLVFWTDQLSPTQAKRLQLAAKNSRTLAFIIRTSWHDEQSLALSLRMKLQACHEGLNIDIFKRQHAWPIEPFILSLKTNWPQLFVQSKRAKRVSQNLSNSNVIPFPATTGNA